MRALFSLAPCRNDNETPRWIRPPNKVFISNKNLPIFVLFGSRRRLLSLHHESDRLDWQILIKLSIIKPRPISPLSALSLLLLRLSWTLCAVQLFSVSNNISQCFFATINRTRLKTLRNERYVLHAPEKSCLQPTSSELIWIDEHR